METNDTLEVIQRIPLDKLRPYPDHPFGVRDVPFAGIVNPAINCIE